MAVNQVLALQQALVVISNPNDILLEVKQPFQMVCRSSLNGVFLHMGWCDNFHHSPSGRTLSNLGCTGPPKNKTSRMKTKLERRNLETDSQRPGSPFQVSSVAEPMVN